jgi:hypothetical protein
MELSFRLLVSGGTEVTLLNEVFDTFSYKCLVDETFEVG